MSKPMPNSQMNITPMIDVLLVLLVIFMAVLPIKPRAIDVKLPPAAETTPAPPSALHVVAEIGPARDVSINSQPVDRRELQSRLLSIFEERRDKTLYVLGAGSLPYSDVMEVIDAAKGAGVNRIGIVTERMRSPVPAGS